MTLNIAIVVKGDMSAVKSTDIGHQALTLMTGPVSAVVDILYGKNIPEP